MTSRLRVRRVIRRDWILGGVFLLCLAAFARFVRLSYTNIGIIEFFSVLQPPGTALADYLERAHQMNPDHVPGYFLFTYLLRAYFGYHWLVPRIAAIVLSLATMLMLAHFTARRFNARTGFLVGLFMALSPAGVYYGIQPRWYQLQIFLLAISMLSLARALERREWWPALMSVIANSLASWTHPFAILFIGAQTAWLAGVIWLAAGPAEIRGRLTTTVRVLAGWAAAHGLVWLLAVRWWGGSTEDTVEWYAPATPMQMLTDLFGDAFLHQNLFAYESSPGEQGMSLAPLAMRGPRDPMLSVLVDSALVLVTVAAFASLGVQLKRAWPWRNTRRARTFALLLIVAFLPPVALYLGATLSFPLALPRYTAFCNIAYWGLIALGIASFPARSVRVALALLLCTVFVVENAYWTRVNAKIRNDWRGVIRCFNDAPNPPERVVCLSLNAEGGECSTILRRMLELYDPKHRGRYLQAYTLAGAVDASSAISLEKTGDDRVYLLTYAKHRVPELRARLETALEEAGFDVRSERHGRFVLYELSGTPRVETWKLPPPASAAWNCARLLPGLKEQISPEEWNAALRWTFEEEADNVAWQTGPSEAAAIARLALIAYEVSPLLARGMLGLLPSSAPPMLVHALCREGFDKAALSPEGYSVLGGNGYEREIAALLAAGDKRAIRERVETVQAADGSLLPQAVLQRAGLEPRLPWAAPLPDAGVPR